MRVGMSNNIKKTCSRKFLPLLSKSKAHLLEAQRAAGKVSVVVGQPTPNNQITD